MKRIFIAMAVVGVAGLCAATNPTSADYTEHLLSEFVESSEPQSEASAALAAAFGRISSELLASVTTRKNYVLFSTYSAGAGDTEKLSLGVLGNFVTLKSGE